MTTRPGSSMLQRLPLHTHATAEVHKITRTDGVVLRLTSHDRNIYFENELYTSTVLQASSSDLREGALRAGQQELYGYTDGESILSSDLLTYAYRGARVETAVIDFARPWLVYGQHTRWVRNLTRSGSRWTATVEGRTAQLDKPNAQRFGGAWHKECPYQLGGTYCKKDVSQWTFIARVSSVVSDRQKLVLSYRPSESDNFYRDGSIEWFAGVSYTNRVDFDSSTQTTITDTSESWTVDEHVGQWVIIYDNLNFPQERALIESNTTDTLTFTDPTPFVVPAAGGYVIASPSDKAGTVSPIASDIAATNTVGLLLPSVRSLVVNEWVRVHPGCDGLITTCHSKYNNVNNHGGDQHAPSGHEIIEQPNDN